MKGICSDLQKDPAVKFAGQGKVVRQEINVITADAHSAQNIVHVFAQSVP